jgi:hypothetical protein
VCNSSKVTFQITYETFRRVARHRRYTGAVVAAILQYGESFQEELSARYFGKSRRRRSLRRLMGIEGRRQQVRKMRSGSKKNGQDNLVATKMFIWEEHWG